MSTRKHNILIQIPRKWISDSRAIWPEVFLARGLSGPRSFWPEVFLARGLSGPRSFWLKVFIVPTILFAHLTHSTTNQMQTNHTCRSTLRSIVSVTMLDCIRFTYEFVLNDRIITISAFHTMYLVYQYELTHLLYR